MKFTFNQLENELRDLEASWRKGSTLPPPNRFARKVHQLQYFALDRTTATAESPLPAVVLVGTNYTQDPSKIPDQSPPPTPRPAVVDGVGSAVRTRLTLAHGHLKANAAAWSDCALAPWSASQQVPPWPERYHLILTNLSPWITTTMWQSVMCDGAAARGGELLAHPPYQPANAGWPYDHLNDLNTKLKLGESWWIGQRAGAVWPRWHSVNQQLNVRSWMLVGNLFVGRFAPNLRPRDGTVKFA
jgi:hypothetical protein